MLVPSPFVPQGTGLSSPEAFLDFGCKELQFPTEQELAFDCKATESWCAQPAESLPTSTCEDTGETSMDTEVDDAAFWQSFDVPSIGSLAPTTNSVEYPFALDSFNPAEQVDLPAYFYEGHGHMTEAGDFGSPATDTDDMSASCSSFSPEFSPIDSTPTPTTETLAPPAPQLTSRKVPKVRQRPQPYTKRRPRNRTPPKSTSSRSQNMHLELIPQRQKAEPLERIGGYSAITNMRRDMGNTVRFRDGSTTNARRQRHIMAQIKSQDGLPVPAASSLTFQLCYVGTQETRPPVAESVLLDGTVEFKELKTRSTATSRVYRVTVTDVIVPADYNRQGTFWFVLSACKAGTSTPLVSTTFAIRWRGKK